MVSYCLCSGWEEGWSFPGGLNSEETKVSSNRKAWKADNVSAIMHKLLVLAQPLRQCMVMENT